MDRFKRLFGPTLVVAAVFVLLAAPASAGPDPFSELANQVGSSARIWAGALLLIGACIAGGAVLMGSDSAGRWVFRFVGGAVLLVLTLRGPQLLDWMATSLGLK